MASAIGVQNLKYNRGRSVINALKLLKDNEPLVFVIDFDRYKRNIKDLHEAFNSVNISCIHAAAVKANPLTKVLNVARDNLLGAECASLSEVVHSLKIGFEPHKIVYDSPCKTESEIVFCLEGGVRINLDNMQEVALVDKLLSSNELLKNKATNEYLIGLRINPQLREGTFAETSTATLTSKFGVGLSDYKEEVITSFASFPFLTGLHVHVGSQGCEVQLLIDGVRALVDVANEINLKCASKAETRKRIKFLDIGGGLPMNYDSDSTSPTYMEYAINLAKQVPELVSSDYIIITEFGRSLIQKCGFMASRVEYIKTAGGQHIATIHAGSNLFLRTAYLPDKWRHYISAHDRVSGEPLDEGKGATSYNIAGPLCFSGDMIAKERMLPTLAAGDTLVIHDAGGYTFSMYSRYNSRPAPPVYSFSNETNTLQCIKKAETIEDSLRMWSDE